MSWQLLLLFFLLLLLSVCLIPERLFAHNTKIQINKRFITIVQCSMSFQLILFARRCACALSFSLSLSIAQQQSAAHALARCTFHIDLDLDFWQISVPDSGRFFSNGPQGSSIWSPIVITLYRDLLLNAFPNQINNKTNSKR